MAKKSRRQRSNQGGEAKAAKTASPPPPAVREIATAHAENKKTTEPQFWFEFGFSAAKLATFRVVVFTLLAIDAVLQISHAPRYGAGGFNVGHFSWLSKLTPARTAFNVVELVLAVIFAVAAVGVATRILLPIATALYAWVYYSSQLDSYQHHYLVSLALVLMCFVDWNNTRKLDRHQPRGGWPMRLLLMQLGIMYLWAAISKCDGAWLDGRTLNTQIHGSAKWMIEHIGGFKVASVLVMLAEFTLAATVWRRRSWWAALPIGLGLHLGILWSGLEIGVFAWLMLAFYMLLLPESLFSLGASAAKRTLAVVGKTTATFSAAYWAMLVGGAGAAVAISALLRLPLALPVVAGSSAAIALAIVLSTRSHSRTAIVHIVATLYAALLLLVVDRTSSTGYDYYRFWAGSESRIGDVAVAKSLYAEVTQRFPDQENGYYQLAKLQIAGGKADEIVQASSNLKRAQALEPKRARAFVMEAKLLQSQGKMTDALLAAQAGASAEPTNVDALTLVKQLSNAAPAVGNNPVPTMPGNRPIRVESDDTDR
jgi:hypothetical protein